MPELHPVAAPSRPLRWLALALPLALAACQSLPPRQTEAPAPTHWRAPAPMQLPHGGSTPQLLSWWQDWNDPVLLQLVQSAQQASPTLAQAAARIAQARAMAVGARASQLPALDGQAGVQRGTFSSGMPTADMPIATSSQAGLQARWEIDLFGGLRHASSAAQARVAGAEAQWHEARVSLAADVANQYFALRSCQGQLDTARRDATSRRDTERLTGDLARAGFSAPATHALTQAGAAQAATRVTEVQAQCTAARKALVALTALDEDTLQQQLDAPRRGRAPWLQLDSVPARVLEQRPDVYAAAQAVAAASDDVGQAEAQRYPRLGLSGNIMRNQISLGGMDADATTWSIGPLSLSVPLFDGGRRRAQADAARVAYEAAASQYRATVRNAVREVETALVEIDSARQRSAGTEAALEGYRKAFRAADARYRAGMGSMLELEDARRNMLAAEQARITLRQQTDSAWVALYRALGGGWQAPAPVASASSKGSTS